jgi:hypothetical protein
VLELRVVLEVFDGRSTRLRIERGVEGQPVSVARVPVALGPEQGTRLGEREVDVEEDCVDRVCRGG